MRPRGVSRIAARYQVTPVSELRRLFAMVLLLAAGFVTAALVGVPTQVRQWAKLLEPAPTHDPYALRPLPGDDSARIVEAEWPALPKPTTKQQQPELAAAKPSAFQSVSWPGEANIEQITAAPPADEWFTADSFSESTPSGELAPIPRTPRAATTSTPAPATEESFATAPPVLEAPRIDPPSPSLDASPYETRRPVAQQSLAEWSLPALPRAEESLNAIERQPIEPQYGDHIVTDGDTLALLAERYLGDANRADEIYQLNRDRLENPDLLPIGMVLRTPAQQSWPALPKPTDSSSTTRPTIDYAGAGPSESLTRPEPAEQKASFVPLPDEPLFDRDVQWDAPRW